MVVEVWQVIPDRYASVRLDDYVVMPNHVHGILWFVGAPLVGARPNARTVWRAGTRPAPTLGQVVGSFKSVTTRRYITQVKAGLWPSFRRRLWQRGYYDHVIRNEESLRQIRRYIRTNPGRWHLDPENLQRTGEDPFDHWLASFSDRPDEL